MEYAKIASEDEKDTVEFLAAEKGYSGVEQPEPFSILRMLRNMNTSYWAGGLADQPYLLLKEMNAAAKGERKVLDRKKANLDEMINKHG